MSDEINPFEHPPVFKVDQVITVAELRAMLAGYTWQYTHTKWWQWVVRRRIRVAVGVVQNQIQWLKDSKPVSYMED